MGISLGSPAPVGGAMDVVVVPGGVVGGVVAGMLVVGLGDDVEGVVGDGVVGEVVVAPGFGC